MKKISSQLLPVDALEDTFRHALSVREEEPQGELARRATLRQVRGRPHQLPPAFALPRLPGLSVHVEHRGGVRTLRE